MAKLLMGAIVVKASGKINGNCFRTFRGQQLLTRLALPTKTNLFRSNPQNGIMAQVFRAWALLSPADRDLWIIIASENPVIDIWGNPKLLSGREYYTRVSSAALLNGYSLPLATEFYKIVPIVECSEIILSMTSGELTFVGLGEVANAKLEIRVARIPNDLNNYGLNKTTFAASMLWSEYTQPDVAFIAVNSIARFVDQNWYQFYICYVNYSGIRSAYSSFKVTTV